MQPGFVWAENSKCSIAQSCADVSWEALVAGCSRPPDQRAIPIADIASATKLTDDGVEFLLMKALSLHLIEGSIDQVAATVQVGSKAKVPAAQRAASLSG